MTLGLVSWQVLEKYSLVIILPIFVIISTIWVLSSSNEPPGLPEIFPFISNAYVYVTDVDGFMKRVSHYFRSRNTRLVKFYVGPMKCYMTTGIKNVQTLFNSPPGSLDADWFHLVLMDKHWQLSKSELRMFADDRTGRQEAAIPGTENVLEHERYWLGHSRLYHTWLSNKHQSRFLADQFCRFFSEKLDEQPTGWSTISLFETIKVIMVESATKTLLGTQILALNPGFAECYWEFDAHSVRLIWGMPRWLMPRTYMARDRLHSMTKRWVDSAWKCYSPNKPGESDWEPHWGSRLSREIAQWFRACGFSDRAIAGHAVGTLFGLHGNTVPITTWALMEIISDPSLLKAVQREVSQAWICDPVSGRVRLDIEHLITLPLLQSVYTEVMRLHISYIVSRKVIRPIMVDGFRLPVGSLLQSCTDLAHREEAIWGTDEHPASEFWAYRHIKTSYTVEGGKVEKKIQFYIRGRPSSFFPYSGGHMICPGRHFAKQEILMAIALVLHKFDVEMVEWTTTDGCHSDRPAQNDRAFVGAVAMHPDRELKIRWRRAHGDPT